jgi:protein O-mannosyl-transferase
MSHEAMPESKLPDAPGSPTAAVAMGSLSGNGSPPEMPSPQRWPTVAVCLALAAMVWAVFGQTRHHEFINYDDAAYVYENPAITGGLGWREMIWVFTHDNGLGGWFPVTDLSHMLDWQLYGPDAGGHHLTNVLLHAATAILLFLTLQQMTRRLWPCAFVAAVFAVHPLRVESVAWVVERKDVLSGLFFMLTLWAYTSYVSHKGGRAFRFYTLSLFSFALGLLSKTMLVTLPFVLLLLDYWPLGRVPADKTMKAKCSALGVLLLEKIPFFLLSAAAAAATVLTQKNAVLLAQGLTWPWRIGNALLAYTDYLRHMFYPANLALGYPHPGTTLPAWHVVWSASLLIIISAGAIAGHRKHRYLLVGWLWYLVMLLPVIDIMQAGQNARADRYTYLPQIGLYLLLTWGAEEITRSWRHRRVVQGLAAAAILAGLLAGAYVQTGYWKTSESLWRHALACTPDNEFVHNNLGNALVAREQWAEAVQHFERALQIKPDYAQAHLNLGVALANQEKREDAIRHFERALQLNPNSAEAHYNLGDALAAQGKWDEAIRQFERALRLKPDFAEAHYGWGLALGAQGKWDEAVRHYEPALHLKLDVADAQYITGVAFATRKQWDQAIELYEGVLRVKPDFAEAHYRLGLALAGRGKPAEAGEQFQQALALATAQGNAALAQTVRDRLETNPPASPHP